MSSSEEAAERWRRSLRYAFKKNPETRFVVNLITPESLAAVLEAVKTLPVTEPDLLTLTAARSKKVGSSHLMMGQNPVWIVTFEGNNQGKK